MDLNDSSLNCTITLEWHKNGSIQRKVSHKNALVSLKRNKIRDIFIEIAGDKFVTVNLKLKGVTIHNKFMAEGKTSINFKEENCMLFISNAPSGKLLNFLKIVFVKINEDSCRTPPSKTSLREQLLSGKLKTFDEISPITINDLKKVTGRVAKVAEVNTSPTSRKRKLNNESVTPPAKKLFRQFTSQTSLELNPEQKRVMDACISGHNVFFTGSAGTGKSFLLKRIIAALPPDVTMSTASTGVAACHIGGVTLHSFTGIGNGEASLDRCVQLASRPAVLSVWKKCKHLIIDEISMVEGSFFEKIEEVARRVRKNDKPFGGIQLILCGDFLQLPPIVRKELNNSQYKKKFCFQTKAWDRCVQSCFELQQVHRQSDPEFVNILNNLRIGRVTEDIEQKLLNTSIQKIDGDGILATKLCSLMQDVNTINQQKLSSLSGEMKIFDAIDSDQSMTKQLDQQTPIPSKLELKVGAQVMLMKNVHLANGLVNGARGIVLKFVDGFPLVKFKNNKEYLVKPERWVIKQPSGNAFSRRQVPLRLAWAFSIHKSQGLTLDCAEVSLKSVFEAGQAYVALSRAQSLETLRVLDFNAKKVWADPDVLLFYRNFRRRLKQMEIVPLGRKNIIPIRKKFIT